MVGGSSHRDAQQQPKSCIQQSEIASHSIPEPRGQQGAPAEAVSVGRRRWRGEGIGNLRDRAGGPISEIVQAVRRVGAGLAGDLGHVLVGFEVREVDGAQAVVLLRGGFELLL